MKENKKILEELKSDRKQLEADIEKLRQQLIGAQYLIQYINTKIKEQETSEKGESV